MIKGGLCLLFFSCLFLFAAATTHAASLSLSPSTGVYPTNTTFNVSVKINTAGDPINAAEGTLSFNPRELSVVNVSRGNSIFNLWVAEPSFSNSAGTISFSGGSPSGYTGQSGTVMTVTFRVIGSGDTRVRFTNGSVLANDGRGTNILSNMNGANYTRQAQETAPEPEVIEYVATANTPSAPVISSDTVSSAAGWYSSNTVNLSWTLPSGITAVRTLLNGNPTSIPTKVYDDPISTIALSDLDEGVSYFHLQFQNDEGWGRVAHYRLPVDTVDPTNISISQPENVDRSSPNQVLQVDVVDETTDVNRYSIKIDSDEPFEYVDETASGTIALPSLSPGYHSVIIEAFDQASNSIIGTYSFTIEAFEKPVFTEYPTEINEEVIPVIKGQTRPESVVTIMLTRVGGEPREYEVTSNATGEFIFIPEGTFSNGVYELTAVATDVHDATSEVSDKIRIAVQQPGYLRIGTFLVNALSVLIPLLVMTAILFASIWYVILYARRFRRRVRIETREALEMLEKEFGELQDVLQAQETDLSASRKTKKLTKAEAEVIKQINLALEQSQKKVEKEIQDIAQLTNRKKNSS